MKKIKVFAPASVANVSCGFDIMGFSVDEIGDFVTLTLSEEIEESTIEISGPYGHLIPTDLGKNTSSVAVDSLLKALNSKKNYHIQLEKNLPLGSGMGSSASSSAAAVFAMNELLNRPFSLEELIPFAMEGERIACGSSHADNVAPSLLGGFVLIRSYSPLEVVKVKCPDDLFSVIVCPEIELHTKDARRILANQIDMKLAVQQSANTAGMILGLLTNDIPLIGRSMSDVIVEPIRKQLIPGYDLCKEIALQNGAIGAGISGSGPSIFAICQGKENSDGVQKAMKNVFSNLNIKCNSFISKLNAGGVKILEC
jgi:homoserine kinase